MISVSYDRNVKVPESSKMNRFKRNPLRGAIPLQFAHGAAAVEEGGVRATAPQSRSPYQPRRRDITRSRDKGKNCGQ